MPITKLALNPKLTQLQNGIEKVVTSQGKHGDTNRIMPRYSSGVLKAEGLLGNAGLAALGTQVSSDLNNVKALMNKLGFKDVTRAPAIKLTSHLATSAGLYHPNPGFSPNPVIPANHSVIIASTLDLTNTTLTIKWPINTLTIIVNTLTCLSGALINYDDSDAWNPPTPGAPPQAAHGASYNPYVYGGGA